MKIKPSCPCFRFTFWQLQLESVQAKARAGMPEFNLSLMKLGLGRNERGRHYPLAEVSPTSACRQPLRMAVKGSGDIAVWCEYARCKRTAANNGATGSNLPEALHKFFRMMESRK